MAQDSPTGILIQHSEAMKDVIEWLEGRRDNILDITKLWIALESAMFELSKLTGIKSARARKLEGILSTPINSILTPEMDAELVKTLTKLKVIDESSWLDLDLKADFINNIEEYLKLYVWIWCFVWYRNIHSSALDRVPESFLEEPEYVQATDALDRFTIAVSKFLREWKWAFDEEIQADIVTSLVENLPPTPPYLLN